MRRLTLETIGRAAYAPISDYGAIGDGRSVALVSRSGSLDWWCPARFDGSSVFGAILDANVGGRFRIAPTASGAESSMVYISDTNVLETLHQVGEDARVRVVDLLVVPDDPGSTDTILLRRVEALEGTMELDIEFAPRFAYGRAAPRWSATPGGLLACGSGEALLLTGIQLPVDDEGAARTRIQLRAGDRIDIIVRHEPFGRPAPFADALPLEPAEMEARTIARWRAWSERTDVPPNADAPLVRRAALALKLLQDARTGAIVAAPTTSLPEAIGGARNWDYRFAWLRDGVLCARALEDAGHVEEADAFAGWLRGVLRREGLAVLYTVGGEHSEAELTLPHLDGYRGSRPVRIGNGAATQHQLDVAGEVVGFLATRDMDDRLFARICEIADHVVAAWRAPDSGIWEMRSKPRHFTLSKALACVALEHASALARRRGAPDAWAAEAAVIRADVMANGRAATDGAFLQSYGADEADASNLLLGILGFVAPRDPSMLATIDRTLRELTTDGLVYRYKNVEDDGIGGSEATFAYCTFWLVEALANAGRIHDARALFDRLVERATPLGLYAEEIDVATGAHLGNFPQGFPHAGLIQAARALAKAERSST